MTKDPNIVQVILDPEFGDHLESIGPEDPVWIVDSATNDPAIRLVRKLRADAGTGDQEYLTTFKEWAQHTPEEHFVATLETIDLHHGWYSANPAWTVMEVWGVELLPNVEAALREYGCDEFTALDGRFRATRPLPPRGSKAT